MLDAIRVLRAASAALAIWAACACGGQHATKGSYPLDLTGSLATR